jgi:hypothetical protein
MGLLLALVCGVVLGVAVGLIASNRRMESAAVTASMGAILIVLTDRFFGQGALPQSEFLDMLSESKAGFAPALALLFPALCFVAKSVSERESFWPALSSLPAQPLTTRLRFSDTIKAFAVAGFLASVAGLVQATTEAKLLVAPFSPQWLVLPLAAVLIGGGSLRSGRGGVAAAVFGATWLAALQTICKSLEMPLVETTVLVTVMAVASGCERLMELSWADTWRLVRGSLSVVVSDGTFKTWGRGLDVLRRTRFVIFALVVLLTYSYVAAYVLVRTPPNTALVTKVQGNVEIYRGYGLKWETAEVGDLLREGCWVRTGWGSSVELRMSDGSVIRIHRDTRLIMAELNEDPEGTLRRRLSMSVGQIIASVKKLPTADSYFEVETPSVVVGVRGTTFIVTVTEERTEVTALEGELVVSKFVPVKDDMGRTVVQPVKDILPPGFRAWVPLRPTYELLSPREALSRIDMAAIAKAENKRLQEFARKTGRRMAVVVSFRAFWQGVLSVTIILIVFILLAQFDFGVEPRDDVEYFRERARHFEQMPPDQRFRRRRRR